MLMEQLDVALAAKDGVRTLGYISILKGMAAQDPVVVKWIVTPENLVSLQAKVVESLGVEQRAMRVKERVAHRQRRAILFVTAMEIAVRRKVYG
jgi:hypothetical protein